MTNTDRKGCLSEVLGIFGIKFAKPDKAAEEFPFRLSDNFLSKAELAFYRALLEAVGGRDTVCPKVNLADIFFVMRPNENQRYRNKIDRKHVDFLICNAATMQPKCGIELDDSSHARLDRKTRDEFVDKVFKAAGLPLIHVPARSSYDAMNLAALIERGLNADAVAESSSPVEMPRTGIPNCPKCGVPMVKRVATKGQNPGKSFFGCPNYPKCREIVS